MVLLSVLISIALSLLIQIDDASAVQKKVYTISVEQNASPTTVIAELNEIQSQLGNKETVAKLIEAVIAQNLLIGRDALIEGTAKLSISFPETQWFNVLKGNPKIVIPKAIESHNWGLLIDLLGLQSLPSVVVKPLVKSLFDGPATGSKYETQLMFVKYGSPELLKEIASSQFLDHLVQSRKVVNGATIKPLRIEHHRLLSNEGQLPSRDLELLRILVVRSEKSAMSLMGYFVFSNPAIQHAISVLREFMLAADRDALEALRAGPRFNDNQHHPEVVALYELSSHVFGLSEQSREVRRLMIDNALIRARSPLVPARCDLLFH